MSMNVSLPPQLEEFVKAKVNSGHYSSASEVVREGLRLLEQKELALEKLRAEIQKGIDSGPGIPAEEVFAELEAKLKSMIN